VSHVFLDVDVKVLSKWERGILRLDKTLVTVNLVLSGGPRCFVVGCACPEALFWGCGGLPPCLNIRRLSPFLVCHARFATTFVRQSAGEPLTTHRL